MATNQTALAPLEDTAGARPKPPAVSGYAWLLAWGTLAVILTLINRTRLGHAVIYYGLVLLIVFILLSNYRFIANALLPFQQQPAAVGSPGASPDDASVNSDNS